MGIFASHAKSSKDNLFTSSSASLQVLPSQVKINCWPLPQHLCKSSSAIANLVPNTPSDDTLVQRSAYSLKLFLLFIVCCFVFFLFTISLRLSTRCQQYPTRAVRQVRAREVCSFGHNRLSKASSTWAIDMYFPHLWTGFPKTFDFSSKWILKFNILDLETCGIPLPRRASRDCSTSKAI